MITQEELQALLHYDADTGVFTWKQTKGPRAVKGDVAGTDFEGYVRIKINSEKYLAHRLAWLYVYGYFSEDMLDHINQNKSDNRICNLREASRSENLFNKGKTKANTSGVKGASWDKRNKVYLARLSVNNRKIYLGRFKTISEAEAVLTANRQKYHGEFTNHG